MRSAKRPKGGRNGGRGCFFGRQAKAAKQLDEKLERIQMNFENNYKDAAQINLREFEVLYSRLSEEGGLSERQKEYYGRRLSDYQARMKNFTHKDQKATWV